MAEPQHPPPPAEAPAAPSPPSSAAENASPAPDKEDPPAQPTLTEQTPPPPLDPLPSDEPPEIPEKEEQQPPETEPEKTLTLEKEPEQVTAESRSLAAMMEKEELPPPQQEVSEKTVAVNADEEVSGDVKDKSRAPQSLVSFKEESNNVADLSEFEKKALLEFKQLVQEALNTQEEVKLETHSPEEFSTWGIPLLKDDRSDVILLKFLRARDFKPKDAFIMIKNTIQWRKDFGIEELVDEDLGDDLDKVVFMHGHDKDGHPVCYNVYGEFQNKELYQKTFSDEEKRMKFLRWRIQFLERSIRKLDFSPGGVCTIFQVNDLKNSPGPGKRELRLATKQALHILQDNYPEFVAKQVIIRVIIKLIAD
ncbi:patellin-3-like [Carica papaya]|uniref:patellin-3-like n=1 Tax=Carica papaya TaxID=3649 RepID=UPI000B8C85E5|nr:patellin-3-like [Carica papaya]